MKNIKEQTCSVETYIPEATERQFEFISELIKVSLFFSSEYQKMHPEEEISFIITRRTSLWEILGIRATEQETTLTDALSGLYKKTVTSNEFESEGFAVLLPHMDVFAVKNIEWEKKVLAKYKDSCFRYDAPSSDRPTNHCNFHITNSISPKSILKERGYTTDCFIKLMLESGSQFGFDTLRTTTWLNSLSAWLEFFPDEWHANMIVPAPEILGNLGSWGQIITAAKSFNFKTGDYIREHLELPFKMKTSWCSFDSMKRHISKL